MTNDTVQTQRIVRLLSVLVVLLAVLVVGLGIGAAVTYHEVSQLRSALKGSTGQDLATLRTTLERTAALAEEATRRQEALAARMDARADKTRDELRVLHRHRTELEGVAKGPIDKLRQMIQLNQLLSDEMLLLLEHVSETQATVARSLRPLPTQRELVPPERGTGGAGAAGTPKPPKPETKP